MVFRNKKIKILLWIVNKLLAIIYLCFKQLPAKEQRQLCNWIPLTIHLCWIKKD